MKMRVFLLACLATLVLSCGPTTVTIRPGPVTETYQPVECPRLPWAFDVRVEEEETASGFLPQENAIYEFKSGQYLKQLSSVYLKPCLGQGPGGEESLPFVSVYTARLKVERVRGPSLLSADRLQVKVTLGVNVYYDLVILYCFPVEGQGAHPVSPLSDKPAQMAADEAYTEAVRKIPNRLAEVLSDLEGLKAELRKEVEQELKSGIAPSTVQAKFVALANLCRLTRAYPEGIAAAKKAIESNPNDPGAYEVLGLIYMDKGDWREAERSFKKALEVDPKRTPAAFLLGRLYVKLGRYEEAAQVFSKLRARAFMGLPSLHLGRFAEVVEYETQFIHESTAAGIGIGLKVDKEFLLVTEVEPSSPADRAGLKVGDRIVKIDGRSTKGWGLEEASKAIRGEEGSEVVLTVERANWDKPQEIRVKREKAAPNRLLPWAFARRALALRALGRKEDFLKDAEAAYGFNPNSSWARGAKAVALIDMSRPKEALVLLEGVKGDPFFGLIQGIAWAKLGDLKRAGEVYEGIAEDLELTRSALYKAYRDELLSLLKLYKDALIREARVQEQRGLYREAIWGYAEYLKLADDKEARELRGHIAELMAKQPHLFALSEEARKAVIRAEAYVAEGKFEKAIEEYREALKLTPFFPGLYKALAYSYAQLKDYPKAIRNLQIYLELYPDAPDARAMKDEIYKWEFMMQRGD